MREDLVTASQVSAKVAGQSIFVEDTFISCIGLHLSYQLMSSKPLRRLLDIYVKKYHLMLSSRTMSIRYSQLVFRILNAAEGNNDVRLAATRALYMALGFAQANFNNDMERDYIMRVVCEATMSPEVKIRQAAFECLVSIASTYYEKLAHYMQDIFNITANAVREDDESVALQAIEFWSSICDDEIDILEEYGGEFAGDFDIPCFYFTKKALPGLVPLLLETLLKQEEDQDVDEGVWNIAIASGTCLGFGC